MKYIPYKYGNMSIPGGGYVTGFCFSENSKNILYARTDIGGIYKYNDQMNSWHSLNEDVDMLNSSEVFPIALAVDKADSDILYAVSGMFSWHDRESKKPAHFSVSLDGGKSFIHKEMPCSAHGNLPGRGTGYRLVITSGAKKQIYYASQREGLFRTGDMGDTWTSIDVCGELHLTFVWTDPEGKRIIVGTAGVEGGNDSSRGHSLFISYDSGESFEPMTMPENSAPEDSLWKGYVPHRYVYDGKYFYCTLNNTGSRAFWLDLSYSCDSGGVTGGIVLRYSFDSIGRVCGYKNITPRLQVNTQGVYKSDEDEIFDYGFGGISCCESMPGLLATGTISRQYKGEIIYISRDYGDNWEIALHDLDIGNMSFNTSYMKPEYNGGHSLIHWLTDVKINPRNPDEIWFNTGTGVFRGQNFTKPTRAFSDCCVGIEETVHLNVYCPVSGPVIALDMVGDLGGFAFTKLDTPCENSFADSKGNRYITCINADISDFDSSKLIVSARGNWTGITKGGLIISEDYGFRFRRLDMPYGISEYLDERLRAIEMPNTNPGFVARSGDEKNIVYCVAEGHRLLMKGVITSSDGGRTFQKTKIFDLKGNDISDNSLKFKAFSDRVLTEVFYGFGDGMTVYYSHDGGITFKQIAVTNSFDDVEVGLIDCNIGADIRAESGKAGVFYVALGDKGLWKYFIEASGVRTVSLTGKGDSVYRVGLGIISPESDYLNDDKALYVCGIIAGQYGFYRSFDDGATWEKINNDSQMFGLINSIDGDCRKYGRYFIATGSFGLKYGEVIEDGRVVQTD
ncbi:MAG: endoglucanase [Wujia sp.]